MQHSQLRLCLLAMAILAGGPVSGAGAQDCNNASDQTTLNMCAAQSFKKTDAELNALYRQIRARLKDNAPTTRLLTGAQKAWLAFRDAECDFAASSTSGGSVYTMILMECRDALTTKRITDFKHYLSCQEGDLSCPLPPG
jgi:uncharacterized protein YecT (DUF1311 family)